MALEDFGTYTEVDEDGDITIATNSITVATMDRDATSYVKFAYPASTFGNFVHKFEINFTAASANTALGGIWMLSNSSNTLQEAITNNEGIFAFVYRGGATSYSIYIQNGVDDAQDSIVYGSAPGVRYLTIQRVGTSLLCLIYTDAGRTTLEDTLVLTVPATAYANVFPVFSRDASPVDAPNISYTVSNLDLQFTPGGTVTVQGGGDGGVVAIPQRSSISAPQQEARKPYLSLKQSMKDFFSEHVRFIKSQNRKESAFEKPYRDYEYPSMHFGIPDPDWPTWKPWTWTPGDWTPSPPEGGGALPVPGCPGCAVYADPLFGSCESNPVEIHSGIWCTNTPGAATEGVTTEKVQVFGKTEKLNPRLINLAGSDAIVDAAPNGVVAGDTRLEVYAEAGAIKDVTVGVWAFIGPSAAVYVVPEIPYHRICGRMVDGAGSVCYGCVDVTCACDCTTADTFAIDTANSDTTIATGSVGTIVVLGGCAPFTWAVAGTGYVLSKFSTTERTNYVTSTGSGCGAGAGNFGPYATVTITDACGSALVYYLLNTAGTWKDDFSYGVTFTDCSNCGGSCLPTNYGTDTYVYPLAIQRWWFDNDYNCVYGTCGMAWGNGANPVPPSPCVTPTACAAAYNPTPCSGAGCTGTCDPSVAKTAPNHATRQRWDCP